MRAPFIHNGTSAPTVQSGARPSMGDAKAVFAGDVAYRYFTSATGA